MSSEFRMFGMTVPQIAIMDGAILSAWGVVAYSIQSADPPSITAMIPAFFGLPMLFLGFLSVRNPANRHHYMHASMVFALLMAWGGGISRCLSSSSKDPKIMKIDMSTKP